jgi:hypothetical protein
VCTACAVVTLRALHCRIISLGQELFVFNDASDCVAIYSRRAFDNGQ